MRCDATDPNRSATETLRFMLACTTPAIVLGCLADRWCKSCCITGGCSQTAAHKSRWAREHHDARLGEREDQTLTHLRMIGVPRRCAGESAPCGSGRRHTHHIISPRTVTCYLNVSRARRNANTERKTRARQRATQTNNSK